MGRTFIDSNLWCDITRENCGHQLRALRERSGLSREDLAKIVGVDPATVLRIEQTNGATPSVDFMNRLKAVQCIGLYNLSKADLNQPDAFWIQAKPGGGKSIVIAELKRATQSLTPAGIIAGLSAMGLAAVAPTLVNSISLPSFSGMSFVGYGVIKALADIARINRLELRMVDNRWELRPVRPKSLRKNAAAKQIASQPRDKTMSASKK